MWDPRRIALLLLMITGVPVFGPDLHATPQFARRYQRDCAFCHLAPPVLNARGEAFLASGYRLGDAMTPVPAHGTAPVSVWNTVDYERRHGATTDRGFLGRVELISAGPIRTSRAAYFAEWRAVSRQIAAGNALLDRSGRFEDLFVTAPIGRTGWSATIGQFRSIAQVDVSRRLSISEPQVFSASLPGARASTPRRTSLRAFSPSGRQPAIRVMWQQPIADRPADGWYAGAAVLFPGELTIPMTEAASFELDGRPKGVVIESFRRSGITSYGGHVFAGENRRLAIAVGAFMLRPNVLMTAAGGVEHATGVTEIRTSIQGEVFFQRALSVGARIEDRTGAGRRAAGVLSFNAHLPFGPVWFRQALRLQIEQRIQPGDHRTLAALSHVF